MGDYRLHSLGKRPRVHSHGGSCKPDERTTDSAESGGKGGGSSKSRLDRAGASRSKPDGEAATAVPVRSKTSPTEVNSAKAPSVDCSGGVGRRGLRTSAAKGKEVVSDQMKVKEAIDAFHKIFEEVKRARKSKHVFEKDSGISLYSEALERMKMSKKCVNPGKLLGPVPGVEIGQEFCCRAELVVTGVHGQIIKGIDWVSKDGEPYATSIVESGQYSNCMKSKDEVIYCGEGGNPAFRGSGCLKDQELSGGNLALRNSMHSNHPVRFTRRYKLKKCGSGLRHANHERLSSCKFVYQGIFYVRQYWIERGPLGKLMYKFRLTRDLTRNSHDGTSNGSRALERVCVDDISRGREKVPIQVSCAVGEDGPSPFNYIGDIIYPELKDPSPPIGCNCEKGCHSRICSCVIKNGGELPYEQDGRISKFRPLVYECGPSC